MGYLTMIACAVALSAAAAAGAAINARKRRSAKEAAASTTRTNDPDPAAEEHARPRQPRLPRKSGEPARILIVDDQPAIRMLLAEVFQTAGLLVHEAANGREAIDAVRSHAIDYLLIDLKMPDMDGIEALRAIRTIDAEVEAAMISAYGDADNIEAARRLGVHQFFTKPFDIEKLRDAVLRQLEQQERKRSYQNQHV